MAGWLVGLENGTRVMTHILLFPWRQQCLCFPRKSGDMDSAVSVRPQDVDVALEKKAPRGPRNRIKNLGSGILDEDNLRQGRF